MTNYTDQLNEVLERLGVDGGELPDNLITTKLDCILANMDQLTQDEAPAIVEASTGTAITLNDSSNKQLQSLTVYGNSTQDSTPTLENPVDIVSVGDCGSVELAINGVNLCKPFKIGIGLNSENGAQIINDAFATTDFILVDMITNSNYYLSGLLDDLYSFVAAYNHNKEFLGRISGGDRITSSLTSASFNGGTAQGTGDVCYLRITQYEHTSTTGTIDEISNAKVLLNIGSSATTYESYKEQTITIELDEPLRAIGDYKDSIAEKDGVIGVERKIQFVEFNGTEAWSTTLITGDKYRHAWSDYESVGIIGILIFMSNNYVNENGNVECSILGSNSAPRCWIIDSNYSTRSLWVSHVQEKYNEGEPLTIIFPLATPIFTPLPSAVQEAWKKLKTYYPITNIINSETANMSINYVADTKTYIDNATA